MLFIYADVFVQNFVQPLSFKFNTKYMLISEVHVVALLPFNSCFLCESVSSISFGFLTEFA